MPDIMSDYVYLDERYFIGGFRKIVEPIMLNRH